MTYSSSLAHGRKTNMASRGQNTVVPMRRGRAIGPVSNTVILIVLACVLGLLYLTQVTKTNAYGYELSNLEQQHTMLQEEHSELEVASARLQSLDRVAESDAAKQLASAAPRDTVR